MTVTLDTVAHALHVKQSVQFINTSDKSLSKLILNDWNNAYSDKYSHLGRRFSDEFVRSFHLAKDSERGYTNIIKLTVNGVDAPWNRIENQIDLIEIPLNTNLESQQTTTLEFEYILKIPEARFTHFGFDNGNYYLKNCFLTIARLSKEGEFVNYSNENLEDIANATFEEINLEFILPKKYEITTDFDLTNQIESGNSKTTVFQAKNKTEIQLAIEEKYTYQSFSNDKVKVETNLYDKRLTGIQKAIIIDKVVNYVSDNLGKAPSNKIMVSQVDYERNPFYGLNQLPAFLSPFPDEFIYEIKFLKAYLYNYLKSSLKTDSRKDGHIFDGIQVYMMMKYIEENYPQMKMLGNLSSYKLVKSYHLTKVDFNEQYNYLFLLMARKNLDQTIGDSKEKFIKFNEQIAGKYKAGLSFKYLNYYLQDSTVENSFREFITLNQSKQTNSSDFEAILKKNAKQNIDWFYPNLINSKKTIDYKFGKTKKTKDSVSVTIKNNSDAVVPILLSGIKSKNVVFNQWISPVKKDTTFIINRNDADKLVLNYNNEAPEYNLRNNFKSLRSVFSLNRPIKFAFLKDLENPNYNQIFYVPEIGYNLYDGAILSITLKNKSLLEKPFVYSVSPSFSTKTNSLTGSVGVALNQQIRDSKLYGISYGLSSSYYHYVRNAAYLKINPSIQFKFRDMDYRSNKRQFISLRQIIVNKETPPAYLQTNTIASGSPLNYSVFDGKYIYQNNEMSKGFGFGTDLQLGENFGKLSTEISYRKLLENNYQFSLRLFAGSFLFKNTDTEFYSFGLDKPKDALFDYNLYGRSESTGLFSQQIVIAEGGFKSKFTNPYANKWMTTLNATSSIWHWIELYGDAGFYQNKGSNVKFVYDSGIHLDLVPNYFELYFPVYSTNGFELGQKNYQEKIRFIVTIAPKTLISLFTRKWF
ncbi:MAG: aminopeptidase [Flavobacterium sp.]